MAHSTPYFTAAATVTFGVTAAPGPPRRNDLRRIRRRLRELAASDPNAADQFYIEVIQQAGSDADSLEPLLSLSFQPATGPAIDAMFAAARTVAAARPLSVRSMIPLAYRLGRIKAGRDLLLLLISRTDDPLILSQISNYIITLETDDAFLVEAFAALNSKNPYRVSALIHQAEFANRQQSSAIMKDVPPITRAAFTCLEAGRPIVLLDGGATGSTIEQQFSGWPADRWKVFGFDPHPNADLSIDHSANVQMIRVALGAHRGKIRLYHTVVDGGSSIYRPNTDYIKYLVHGPSTPLTDLMSVATENDVEVVDLDSWRREHHVPPFDFMKLNVQGAELDILRGAAETLGDCFGLQCEVGFAPIYREAPAFRDVDAFLDSAGFTFFDLRKPTTNGRATKRTTPMVGSRVGLFRWPSRQMTEAHVLYLRDPYRPEEQGSPRWRVVGNWLRLAIVAEMNGQIDFAMQVGETVLQDFSNALPDGGDALRRGLDDAASFYRDFDIRNR